MLLLPAKRKSESNEKNETDSALETLRKIFKDDIKFTYITLGVILIWCPSSEVDPSFMVSLLGSYDSEVKINNHWVPVSALAPLKVWRGALATYSSEKLAEFAADDIRRKYRFLKVVFFQEILNILMLAESHHPKPSVETTMVVFKANNLFNKDHVPGFKILLKSFGKPSKVRLYLTKSDKRVIAEAEYPTQYQAYAAKIALDGIGFRKLGYVSVEIAVTESGKNFDKFVRYQFRCITDNY